MAEPPASQPIFAGNLLKLRVDTIRLPSGRTATREIVEHPGAIAILPLMQRDGAPCVVLVRQYRPAVGCWLWEIPAGTLEPGEDPLACAQRELREETNLMAGRWSQLLVFYTAPGFCDEKMTLFLAHDLQPAEFSTGRPEDENLHASTVTIEQAWTMVEKAEIQDAKSILALLYLKGGGYGRTGAAE